MAAKAPAVRKTAATGAAPAKAPPAAPAPAAPSPVRRLKTRLAAGSGIVRAHPRPATSPAAGVAGGADAAPGGGAAGTTVVDYGGPVIPTVTVRLVFWGSAWAAGTSPSADEVTTAVQTLLASSYMAGLNQYRGVGGGAFAGAMTESGSDPPNPFSNDDVSRFLTGCFEAGSLPEPETDPSLLYCVIMPPGVAYTNVSTVGEHSYYWYTDFDLPFDLDVNKVHYAWVMNDGTLSSVTRIFSHELVESVTDPEGDGVQLNAPGICTADPNNWCEIGDVCSSTGQVAGVTAQTYWSQADGMCVVPSASTLP